MQYVHGEWWQAGLYRPKYVVVSPVKRYRPLSGGFAKQDCYLSRISTIPVSGVFAWKHQRDQSLSIFCEVFSRDHLQQLADDIEIFEAVETHSSIQISRRGSPGYHASHQIHPVGL